MRLECGATRELGAGVVVAMDAVLHRSLEGLRSLIDRCATRDQSWAVDRRRVVAVAALDALDGVLLGRSTQDQERAERAGALLVELGGSEEQVG